MQRFAFELRKLRAEAGGLTYRAMARRAGYSGTTLSQAAAGEQLPTLAVTLAYVAACGGSAAEWEARWQQTVDDAASSGAEDPGERADAPYRGLARFEPGDSRLFFGRDRLTADLLDLLRRQRFAAVFGPSGSGKSSLLRAGLVPALQQSQGTGLRPAVIQILTPGDQPARAHARLLDADGTGNSGDGGDRFVIVDQFEEVYTLCHDAAERARFIDLLLASRQPACRLRVLIAVRADFYGRCAEHPALADALRDANLLVGPMSPAELRDAVVKPATAAGLTVERALTARLVEETSEAPGGLPLMSHALLETWRRRRGKALTLTAYEASGGVHGAIARTAEHLYTQFSAEQAALARHMLLRLITPGEGAPDTRRPAPRTELDDNSNPDSGIVLDRLARARLITLDNDTVDLAHEALITAWPRLHSWIERDRELLRRHRQLTEAATAWDRLDREPGALYRGTRLVAAEEAFAVPETRTYLTPLERSFLTTSLQARDDERRTATRAGRRMRALTGTLAVLLVLAVTAAGLALGQRNTATAARNQALSRQLAAQSEALLDTDPDLASLLAVQAYRATPTAEAVASLYGAAALPLRYHLTGHTGQVWAVAFSPDGRALATVSDDFTVRLWDTATGAPRATLTGHNDVVAAVAFSPDGRTLATGGADGIRLWDTATERVRAVPTSAGAVLSLAFGPDSRTLAEGGSDGTVKLRDAVTGESRATLTGHTGAVWAVAFSPEGRTLATAAEDRTARLWNASTGMERAALDGHTGPVRSVAFSPDGRTLATGSSDRTIRLWKTAGDTGHILPARHTAAVTSVAFSPDGHRLASTGNDRTIRLSDVTTGESEVIRTGHTQSVMSVAFAPDGNTLATGSEDRTARLWTLGTGNARTLNSHTGPVRSVAPSPDGRTLATAGDDFTVRLWDTVTGRERATLRGHTAAVRSVTFDPSGRNLATGGVDGTVRLWDTRTGMPRGVLARYPSGVWSVTFTPDGTGLVARHDDGALWLRDAATGEGRPLRTRHTKPVWSVALSPDGRTLATGSYDRVIRLQDLATGKERAVLSGHRSTVKSVAFSPDGRTLVSSGEDRSVRLWDTHTGNGRAILNGHGDQVWAVAFSADGRTVASSGDDGTVRLWDVSTSRLRTMLAGHKGPVRSVAFTPDSHVLATGSSDGTTRLWKVALPDPTAAIAQICRALHRDFTPTERSAHIPEHTGPVCPS